MSVLEEVLRELVGEADALSLAYAVVDYETGDEDGGEHRGDDTYDEGGCEALYRT